MRCLSCHYDLRNLVENRCPECGRAFDPQDFGTFASGPCQVDLIIQQGRGRAIACLAGLFAAFLAGVFLLKAIGLTRVDLLMAAFVAFLCTILASPIALLVFLATLGKAR